MAGADNNYSLKQNNMLVKINELLCFLDNNFGNLAKTVMISTLCNFYNEKEISEARI